MKVALDATPLTLTSGGLRRYTQELSRALIETCPDDRFFLASDQVFPDGLGIPRLAAPRGVFERRWWLYGSQMAMRSTGVDLFHGTNFEVPYLPFRPSVLTLHDLSPWVKPYSAAASVRVRRRVSYLIRSGIATVVVTCTEAIRRAAMERFHIHPDRIFSVPLGGLPELRCDRIAVARQPIGKPYVLYVGALEERKNVDTLLAAWRRVRQSRTIDLVLVGRARGHVPVFGAETGLHVLGEVADEHLRELYSNALVFVYPSLYEGFGLPVLEAIQCGAPVITSRDPAIREVAGDAAIFVEALDARALADAIAAVVDNSAFGASMRDRSLARGREFSWSNTARLTRRVYDEAYERFRRET